MTTTHNGYAMGTKVCNKRKYVHDYTYRAISTPKEFNEYFKKGYLLNPMNQYQCGGCWSFAINGAIADKYNIKYRGALNRWMSPQFLISCVKKQR